MLKSKLNWKSAPIPAESGTAKWKDYCIWYISLIFSNGPKKLGSKHGGGGSFRHRLKCYGIIVNTLAPGAMFTPGCMVHDPVRTLPPEKVGRIFLADISRHFRTFLLRKFRSFVVSSTDNSTWFFRVWVTVWVRTENQRRRICAAVNKE